MRQNLTKKQIKERIEKLRKEINYHRYLYHVLDRQEISDAALDSLKHELWKLEQNYPEFITPDSPTQRVGGQPLDKFKKVRHLVPMISLEDTFAPEEIYEWQERIQKLVPLEKLDYFTELKIDGFAISLVYQDGIFVEGSTRGDGLVGEEVTQNLKTIEAIPLKLHQEIKGRTEVRGEVYMTIKAFEKVNQEQKKKRLEPYANPRNTAAGSIRQLDPKIAASRQLDFLAYDLVTDLGQKTHQEKHQICKELGFKTDKLARPCKNLEEVIEFWQEIGKKREKLAHQIDGIVVTVNDNKTFEKLGVIGKAPRGAIAFKFPGLEATTKVKNIIVQVGRTGKLTPVAILEPVKVGGVTISRATLHNENEIKRLDVKIGDTVIVQRAGDVIPDIKSVIKNLRTGKEKKFLMPKKCPICGSKVYHREGEVDHYCSNKKCFATQRRGLYHFVSKKAFDIEHLGPKIIDKLVEVGLISDAADIFILRIEDILPLESLPRKKPKAFVQGFAEKSAQNLIEAINKAKKIPLSRFIYALGIRHVGEETSQLLAGKFQISNFKFQIRDLIKQMRKWSSEDLQSIPDIGPVVGQSIYDWFHQEKNIKFLEKLEKAGVKFEVPKIKVSQKLAGKTFVLTGTLKSMTRDQTKEKIRLLGGDISSSLSKNTDFVVAGEEPGTKYERAKKLSVRIIDEEEFLKMIK